MLIIPVVFVILLALIDQLTKYFVVMDLKPIHSLTLIKDFFSLTYVENRGAAFGTMEGARWLFVALTVAVTILGGLYYVKSTKKGCSKFLQASLVLIIGGAIGNCIDRLFRGYVVDMLSFKFFGYSFAVFNFADICVVVGAILLVLSLLFAKEEA